MGKSIYSEVSLDGMKAHMEQSSFYCETFHMAGYDIVTEESHINIVDEELQAYVASCNAERTTADGYELVHDDRVGDTITYYVFREDGNLFLEINCLIVADASWGWHIYNYQMMHLEDGEPTMHHSR